MFELWEFPETLVVAVSEVGDPEVDEVAYPIVRLVSSLGVPGIPDHNIGLVAE
jgi:hypothetical protein